MAISPEPATADDTPRGHAEPLSTFLARSTRSEAVRARALIGEWIERLCAGFASDVICRLQSTDDQEFTAGFWELYLHEMFVQLGYGIECEKPLPNGSRIDFLLSRGDNAFYVEATIARKSADEQAADSRRNRIYEELDKVRSSNFMLGITIETAATRDLPRLQALRRRLDRWLTGLGPDDAARKFEEEGELPSFPWADSGWSLEFKAIPSKPEFRDVEADRALGMFMDETGGLIDDERLLLRALKRKRASKYGELALPFVVAICESPFSLRDNSESHRMNVFFGHHAVQYTQGPGERALRWIRTEDGFWRGPGGSARNRRVAAVLLASHVSPWSVDDSELEWWINPFALQPVPESGIPEATHQRWIEFDAAGAGILHHGSAARRPGAVMLGKPGL